MTATDHTDMTGEGGDVGSPWPPGRRLTAVVGAALVAGLLAGGATGLAGVAGWAIADGNGGTEPIHSTTGELADVSGQLATSIALYAAAGPSGRDPARARLELDAARIAALLSRLPPDGSDSTTAATMRRLLAGIGAEIEDLRRLVARHDEEVRALDAIARQVRERHRLFERSLALPGDAARATLPGDDADGTRRHEARNDLDETGDELASHLYAALATGDAADLAKHRSEAGRLADRLRRTLESERVDETTVRRMDAARRLAALGVDTDNVFERREALADLAAAALAAAHGARDRADALGALARATSNGDTPGFRPVAPALVAAALASGLVTALALAASLQSTGARPPRPPTAASEGGNAPVPAGTLPPLRIVVADDEPLNRMVAAALLGRNGHSVTLAEDGAAAVESVVREPADLVIMDLRMPRLDGIGATRAIRALPDPRRAGTRIVVLTASAIPDDARDAEAAGADAVLPKPLRWDTLEPLLRRLFTNDASPPEPAHEPVAAPAGATDVDETAIRQMREMLPAERVNALIGTTEAALAAHHAALMAAWTSGNREEVSALAHRIAGVAGVYGCTALRAAAQAVEQAIDRGIEDPSDLIRTVDGKTGPALAYLRSLLPGGPERG
ncbi:response regulator [Azospirillum sp. RWY-5-1]|uniref:Response regulator n=1 Tax=Azospirillum oleiclasticum TaxID=2735135 RepID=A0ABX2T3B7_9PROT|nr:response regulator [Azospirillum oleiclasticum]NYZ11633.1 response regulator [Azospirillum oleiclasticum]NYZ18794.1 response regulator [Azospirillum oleiclasticum]